MVDSSAPVQPGDPATLPAPELTLDPQVRRVLRGLLVLAGDRAGSESDDEPRAISI